MKNNKILIIFISIFIIFSTIFVGINIFSELKSIRYIGKNDLRNTLSVMGQGEIYVRPNIAVINFSVRNEGSTAQNVLDNNTQKTNQLIDFLKTNNIDEKNIKTIAFNIYPIYEYEKEDFHPSGKRILVGYQAYHSVEVRIYNIDKIGFILDGAIKSGANEVGGINFLIEQENEYAKKVELMAIDDAKKKALELADKLGVRLVQIVNYKEDGQPISFIDQGRELDFQTAEGMSPDIQFGKNRIFSNVILTYEIE